MCFKKFYGDLSFQAFHTFVFSCTESVLNIKVMFTYCKKVLLYYYIFHEPIHLQYLIEAFGDTVFFLIFFCCAKPPDFMLQQGISTC